MTEPDFIRLAVAPCALTILGTNETMQKSLFSKLHNTGTMIEMEILKFWTLEIYKSGIWKYWEYVNRCPWEYKQLGVFEYVYFGIPRIWECFEYGNL